MADFRHFFDGNAFNFRLGVFGAHGIEHVLSLLARGLHAAHIQAHSAHIGFVGDGFRVEFQHDRKAHLPG